jgi:hypothetical protein
VLAVAELEQEFFGAIRRELSRRKFEPGDRKVLVELRSERGWKLVHLLKAPPRELPKVLHDLRCAKRPLAVLPGKFPQKQICIARNQIEEINAAVRRVQRFMRHFRSFHQLYAITKFNPLPSLLRLAAD